MSSHAAATRGARQQAIVQRTWLTAKQVHGSHVVVVDGSTDPTGVGEADALVTTDATVAVAVRTADCAPVALAGGGVAAIAHAGWRGLEAGVLANTVETMRALGADDVQALLGPCVHAECYEFGDDDLDRLAARFGDGIRSVTADGRPALDVPRAVEAALADLGVPLVHDVDVCTSCAGDDYWSHRARAERDRQVTVVWLA